MYIYIYIYIYDIYVMDCHATTRGSISGVDGVKTKLHVLCKGQ